MTRREIKLRGKEIMKTKWGIILLTMLLVSLGTTAAGVLAIGIGSLIVMGPLLLGEFYIFEDVRNGKEGDWKDIIKGFKLNFGESLLAKLLIEIVTIIPTIVAIFFVISTVFSVISSIVMSSFGSMYMGYGDGFGAVSVFAIGGFFKFIVLTAITIVAIYFRIAFVETFYILMREPGITAVEAIKKSRAIMKGHIGQYVMFILSFIGWFLLGAISFGIAYIWVLPYYEMSKIILLADIYENKLGIKTENSIDDLRKCEDDSNNIKNDVSEVEAVPKYCGECGTPIVDGAGFCVNCGKPLQ